jgi:hypothetical protein
VSCIIISLKEVYVFEGAHPLPKRSHRSEGAYCARSPLRQTWIRGVIDQIKDDLQDHLLALCGRNPTGPSRRASLGRQASLLVPANLENAGHVSIIAAFAPGMAESALVSPPKEARKD